MVYESATRTVSAALLDRIVRFVFPASCLGCARPLPGDRQWLGLCLPCRGKLICQAPDACPLCGLGRPPIQGKPGRSCPACQVDPPTYDLLLAGWRYRPPLDAVIWGLKYRRLEYLGEHLALGLWQSLGERLGDHDLVVPLPLHWRRRWSRGYDQAAVIARALARLLELPLCAALRRQRATGPQSGLGRRARSLNLRGAFRLGRASVAAKRILLVDDVITTGATINAAASCLKTGGARWVTVLAAARTPDPW